MSEWKKVKFLDLFSEPTKNGIYKSKEFHGRGAKIINMGEVFAYSFIGNQEMSRVEINDKERNSFLVKNGDLLFARRSLVESGAGKCAIVNGITEETTFESSIIRVRLNENNAIPLFYMYWMRSLSGRTAINGIVNGVNVKGIRATDLQNIEVELPPMETQHRIASILSCYDYLIENYQKQIKLLEEAAQRLYKEWFVDLHFPDHENTKIVDGVPEGWEKKTLDEFCSVFTGKKNANAAVQSGKYKFFTCGDTPLQIDSYIYDGPAIIISGNGSYTGRTTFYEGKFDLYQRTYACTINNNENRDLIYGLFEIVKCELTTQISGGTHGAAIPYIVMGDVTKFTFTSNDIVLRKFSKIIKSFLDRTMCISSQIRLLTEARDRLLPKLMDGEIKV